MAKKNDIVKATSVQLQQLENIENLIRVIRGKQVMLDRDLARLYGVETRVLNQAVQRNIERFPEDFMFQLSKEEFENWKSQFAISNYDEDMSSQFATTSAENMKSQITTSSGEEKWKSQIVISNSIKMGARKLPKCPYCSWRMVLATLMRWSATRSEFWAREIYSVPACGLQIPNESRWI